MRGEKLYLSPVMDLFSGEIIAFETARRPGFKLVENMLSKALEKLASGEKPIVHSDRAGTTKWQLINANCKSGTSSRACRARATASTTQPWIASVRC